MRCRRKESVFCALRERKVKWKDTRVTYCLLRVSAFLDRVQLYVGYATRRNKVNARARLSELIRREGSFHSTARLRHPCTCQGILHIINQKARTNHQHHPLILHQFNLIMTVFSFYIFDRHSESPSPSNITQKLTSIKPNAYTANAGPSNQSPKPSKQPNDNQEDPASTPPTSQAS
jgi:hypothetical protein